MGSRILGADSPGPWLLAFIAYHNANAYKCYLRDVRRCH